MDTFIQDATSSATYCSSTCHMTPAFTWQAAVTLDSCIQSLYQWFVGWVFFQENCLWQPVLHSYLVSKLNCHRVILSCPAVRHLLRAYATPMLFNSLRSRRNDRYNADDIFKCIFLKENVWIPTKISLKFVPKGRINNIPALVQIMAWRRPGH